MSDSGKTARPRQLTMAGWFVVGGSVFLLLSIFDTFSTLNTLDARDGPILKMLTAPGGVNLGLGDAISTARAMLTVGAVCASAAAVLGFFVLQRNRGARIVLSILAVPILLTGFLTGGLIGALVVAATGMLWSGPARDWFAGRPVREVGRPERPEKKSGPWETTMPRPGEHNRPPEQPADPVAPSDDPADSSADPQSAPASSLSTAGSSSEPGAMRGFGQTSAPVADQPTASWVPPAGAPSYATVGAARPTMPAMVKAACILTWVFSGMVALLYAGMLVILVADQDRVVDAVVKSPAWKRSNIDPDVLVPALWIGALLFLAWALGACVLAVFTWRRHNWARWLLAASAACVLLIGFVALPVGLVHQLAAAVVIAGLVGPSARVWFANDLWRQGPPPGYQSGYQAGYPGPDQSGQRPQYPDRPPEDAPQQHPDQDQSPPPGGKPPVW
jgi:hypothetical protein